jgi:hypothetical protein
MKKPKPPIPPGHVAAHIYKPAYDNRRDQVIKYDIDAAYGRAIQSIPSKMKPPPFHCVPGRNLNWSPARGFVIDPVQAIAICGAQPNPLDPVYLNNRERCLRNGLGLGPPRWEPKYWVQELDPATQVSCNKCLALMRAALRVKLRYRPHGKAHRDTKPEREAAYARCIHVGPGVWREVTTIHQRDESFEVIPDTGARIF